MSSSISKVRPPATYTRRRFVGGILRAAAVASFPVSLFSCASTRPFDPNTLPANAQRVELSVSGRSYEFVIHGTLSTETQLTLEYALSLYPRFIVERFSRGTSPTEPPMTIYVYDPATTDINASARYMIEVTGERQLIVPQGGNVRYVVHELGHAMGDYLVQQAGGKQPTLETESYESRIQVAVLGHKRAQLDKATAQIAKILPEVMPKLQPYLKLHAGDVKGYNKGDSALRENFLPLHRNVFVRHIMEQHFVSTEAYVVQPYMENDEWDTLRVASEYWTDTWAFYLLDPNRLRFRDPEMYAVMTKFNQRLRSSSFDLDAACVEINAGLR